MDNFFNDLLNNINPMNKLMPLKSIYLDDKIVVELPSGELKSTLRIEKGMHVRLAYNTLLDCSVEQPSNATISELMGDIFSTQLEAHLILNTGEEVKLILK
jgi:hypothetical protein